MILNPVPLNKIKKKVVWSSKDTAPTMLRGTESVGHPWEEEGGLAAVSRLPQRPTRPGGRAAGEGKQSAGRRRRDVDATLKFRWEKPRRAAAILVSTIFMFPKDLLPVPVAPLVTVFYRSV